MMQLSGKFLVLSTFAIGLTMAGGAWLYHYQQSRRAAEFWGVANARLLVNSEKVVLVKLAVQSSADDRTPTRLVAPGLRVGNEIDLTNKKGLVHLRHALTNDSNFNWDEQRAELIETGPDWEYVLQFTRDGSHVNVLFAKSFALLGKLDDRGTTAEVVPCPRLGPVIAEYLGRIGIPSVDAGR
jgi:hypothetical protein